LTDSKTILILDWLKDKIGRCTDRLDAPCAVPAGYWWGRWCSDETWRTAPPR